MSGFDGASEVSVKYKNIAVAVGITVAGFTGAMAWLDTRFESHAQRAVAPLYDSLSAYRVESAERLTRVLVNVNLTKCAVLEIPRLECDTYEGVER